MNMCFHTVGIHTAVKTKNKVQAFKSLFLTDSRFVLEMNK